jgi:cytochrome P450
VQGILVLLLSYPPVYTRLQVEIDTFCAENADELEYPIQDSLARKLPYLQACIAEGLRKCTPLFQLRERVVPPEGDLLNGHFVPGGTFVGINNLATQNDDAFGKDVDMFRPQRWLTTDVARLKHMRQTLDLGFGYGNSKCLGVNLAYMEMNKIIFEVHTFCNS